MSFLSHGILTAYHLRRLRMRVFFTILLAMAIAGCGHKGPLTLPKPKPDAQKPAPEARKTEPPVVVLPDEREPPVDPAKR